MTDLRLGAANKVIAELVETIETAKGAAMRSNKVVLPRERVLDLLDALLEALPPDLADARAVLARRQEIVDQAEAHAQTLIARTKEHGIALVRRAESEAADIVTAGERHVAQLVESTDVVAEGRRIAAELRQAAVEEGSAIRREAEAFAAKLRTDADEYARAVRTAADEAVAKLRADAEEYDVQSRVRSNRAIIEAQEYAATLRADAASYADDVFAELTNTSERVAQMVAGARAAVGNPASASNAPQAMAGESAA